MIPRVSGAVAVHHIILVLRSPLRHDWAWKDVAFDVPSDLKINDPQKQTAFSEKPFACRLIFNLKHHSLECPAKQDRDPGQKTLPLSITLKGRPKPWDP